MIANRGEVAVRIIRCCQEQGFTSILLHSTADKKTSAYRMADEVVELPGNTPLETYLNIPKVIDVTVKSRADFLHPGFGFLSENSDFVEQLEKTKVKFVGPNSKSIRLAGNKIKAKELAAKAGVPVTPAYIGTELDPQILLTEAKKIGFPCIIKPASGGGGKGMKVVTRPEDFTELLSSAQREALSAFGNAQIFIEKYLTNPRHIEVQVLADNNGHALHFFERDCTIQRRHQKIFEETPAGSLSSDLREEMASSALRLVKAASYRNAGTVEFLLDDKNNFYFMELNTRLQVEHTVTEEVCGVDLVKLQFDVAMENEIGLSQQDIIQRGHALEVRIYAETPENQFLPSMGEIGELRFPLGPHRRFDFGYGIGDVITPFYDPMIGKIITWAETREENLKRMYATLCETVIFGVDTNIEFLKSVLRSERYQKNKFGTRFLEEEYEKGYKNQALSESQKNMVISAEILGPKAALSGLVYQSPWQTARMSTGAKE